MELRVDILVHPFTIEPTNEHETVEAMGNAVRSRLLARLRFGQGASSSLPRPKAGGQPYQRTGTLVGSIQTVMRQAGRGRVIGPQQSAGAYAWTAVVRPTGDRPKEENIQRKRGAAKAKTRERRTEATVAFSLASLGGNAAPSRFVRSKPNAKGDVFRLSRIRVRTADSNAALAGILSVRPNDTRSKKGGRGVYRVFEATDEYRRIAAAECKRVAKFEVRVQRRSA